MRCSKSRSIRSSARKTSTRTKRSATRVASTELDTLVGHVAWGSGPVKNVAKTPLVGGQWVKGQKHRFDLAIVNNQLAPNVPLSGPLKLIA